MGHGRALQHPMKMGVWRKRAARAFSSEVETGSRQENASIKKLQARFRLKTRRLKGSPDAMNMAWTPISTSTMLPALNRNPSH
jgi:hypothetical protein